jgi:hypothetical protein
MYLDRGMRTLTVGRFDFTWMDVCSFGVTRHPVGGWVFLLGRLCIYVDYGA